MHSSSVVAALSALAALASAVPTPAQPVARCGTTVGPTELTALRVHNGETTDISSYLIQQQIEGGVVQDNTIVNFALFQIPPNSYGCQLVAQFGANDIDMDESLAPGQAPFNARVNVTNIDITGKVYDLTSPEFATFSNHGSLFGTFNLIENTKQVVNSASCPPNGGFLLFELALDSSLPATTAALFPQSADAGLFVQYNC